MKKNLTSGIVESERKNTKKIFLAPADISHAAWRRACVIISLWGSSNLYLT